jgi:hypothetical protein
VAVRSHLIEKAAIEQLLDTTLQLRTQRQSRLIVGHADTALSSVLGTG